MMDEDFNRGGNLDDDGERNAGQNIELLDAFVSYDGDVGSMPYTLRLGKQVINWGELPLFLVATQHLTRLTWPLFVVQALKSKRLCFLLKLSMVQSLSLRTSHSKLMLADGNTIAWKRVVRQWALAIASPTACQAATLQDVYYIGGGFKSGDQFAGEGAAPLAALGGGDPASLYTASAAIIGAVLLLMGVNCATGK